MCFALKHDLVILKCIECCTAVMEAAGPRIIQFGFDPSHPLHRRFSFYIPSTSISPQVQIYGLETDLFQEQIHLPDHSNPIEHQTNNLAIRLCVLCK